MLVLERKLLKQIDEWWIWVFMLNFRGVRDTELHVTWIPTWCPCHATHYSLARKRKMLLGTMPIWSIGMVYLHIFTYIWLTFIVDVGKCYQSHGSYGIWSLSKIFQNSRTANDKGYHQIVFVFCRVYPVAISGMMTFWITTKQVLDVYIYTYINVFIDRKQGWIRRVLFRKD